MEKTKALIRFYFLEDTDANFKSKKWGIDDYAKASAQMYYALDKTGQMNG